LPKRLALEVNEFNIKQFEIEKKKEAKRLEKEKGLASKLAEKIKSISCTITAEAQADDTLYGTVTVQDIERSLKEEGFSIDKKQILLDEPIKKLGVYQIPVKLHPEITSSIKIWIVKK
jgi:large subunit ribosomal protein L9